MRTFLIKTETSCHLHQLIGKRENNSLTLNGRYYTIFRSYYVQLRFVLIKDTIIN
jgi:hypothetical protein